MITIKGAYGRTYKDWTEAETDWVSGKDFKIVGGPYMSVRDLDRLIKDGYDPIIVETLTEDHILYQSTLESILGGISHDRT